MIGGVVSHIQCLQSLESVMAVKAWFFELVGSPLPGESVTPSPLGPIPRAADSVGHG